ncbi:MAG: tetratricopeptide repeat protein [Candidatus Gastranaerophilaceae bacterium]|jgi:tetratricopeptide (TPR) repeat protein
MKILKLLPLFVILVFLSACSNLDIQQLNQKAMEYMQQGDVDSAIARLESINDLNPNFPQTNYNLGIAYHKKHEYKKAIASLDKATELKKDFAQAYYTKGVIYEEMAINIFEPENSQNENNTKGKLTLQDKQKAVEYFKKSAENFEEYLNYSPTAQDANEVKAKIEQLNKDSNHYSSSIDSSSKGNN